MEADRVLHRPTARRAVRTLALRDPIRTLVRRKVLPEVRRHGGKLRVQGSREHTRMGSNAHRPAMPPLVHIVRVTMLHGSAGGHSGPPLACVQAMRTDFGRPSSSMRFRTMRATFISVA